MTVRKYLLALTALALIAFGGLSALKLSARDGASDEAATNDSARLLSVPTVTAKQVDSYVRERRYTGMLKESRRSQLSFQRSGEVIELLADQGAAVSQGQILGRLDCRHIEARRAQLESQLAEATAVLDELTAGPRPEVIAAKQAELRAQIARRDSLTQQVNRRESLVGTNAVSREEFESFSFDLAAASAQVDQLQSQLDELLAGTRREQIEAQRGRCAQLRAALADVEHDLQDTVLRAPYSGRIAERSIDEGTIVSAGTPVFELLDDSDLEAWVGLPLEAAHQFQVGGAHSLECDGATVEARVMSLSAEVDNNTRTRMLRLGIGSAEESGLLPGQVVRIAVQEQVDEPGYWIPSTALARGTRGLWSVYVIPHADTSAAVERRDVELLDTVGEQSFVRGALRPGEQIVASGTHRIVAGQRVIPQPQLVANLER